MTDTGPNLPRRLLIAALLIAALAGSIWMIRGSGAPAATEFLPPRGGYHTAWLVAGPLDKPLPEPQKLAGIAEKTEVGGARWRLVTAGQNMVTLAGKPWTAEGPPDPAQPAGENADRPARTAGVFYAAGSLLSKGGGRRSLLLRTLGECRVWVNGKPVGTSRLHPELGVHEIDADLELKAGANPIIVETRSKSGSAVLLCCLRREAGKASDDRLFGRDFEAAPETMALSISGRSELERMKLLASTMWLTRDRFSVWADPGDELTLRVVRGGSAPRVTGSLTVEICARHGASADAKPLCSRTQQAAGLLKDPLELKVKLPAGDAVEITCQANLSETGSRRLLVERSMRFYSNLGIESAAQRLEKRALEAGRRLGMDNVALAILKAEKCRLILLGFGAGESKAQAALEELKSGKQALAAAEKQVDPLANRVGWLERAYWCPTDGSAQPYRLNVPRRLTDPAEQQGARLPLVVYLHGYVPGHNKHQWVEWSEVSDLARAAEELGGAILLAPFGRSNTDFVSIGEVDVLRAIEETCRHYPVDRRRIYLYGYSMGGYGAYTLATHFPDRFAGLLILAARPEPYYLERQALVGKPRARQPVYKGYCLDVDNPSGLAVNLLTVPTMVVHATRDAMVPIAGTRDMVVKLKNMKAPVKYLEVEGDHFAGFDLMSKREPMQWLLSRKLRSDHASLRLRTFSPRFGKLHWARIDLIDRWTGPADLEVSHDNQGRVTVTASNVREFTLKDIPAPGGLKPVGFEKYVINAIQRDPEKHPDRWDIRAMLRSAPREGRWRKTAALCGPMKEACNTPFIVVYDRPAAKTETSAVNGMRLDVDPESTEGKARIFAREWEVFAKGRPTVKCEKDLTPEEKAGKSIILFCTPSRSRLLAEARPTLECSLTDGEFAIAGRKAPLGPERGLVLTRPNPWAPDRNRYLVICTGLLYGRDAAENHKLDLIPDFIVFTAGKEGEGEPPAVLAGYFDTDWKADPKLVEVFKP